MTKKTYTAPLLKSFVISTENSLLDTSKDGNIPVNPDPYDGEASSATHQWDSSNWSDADED